MSLRNVSIADWQWITELRVDLGDGEQESGISVLRLHLYKQSLSSAVPACYRRRLHVT